MLLRRVRRRRDREAAHEGHEPRGHALRRGLTQGRVHAHGSRRADEEPAQEVRRRRAQVPGHSAAGDLREAARGGGIHARGGPGAEAAAHGRHGPDEPGPQRHERGGWRHSEEGRGTGGAFNRRVHRAVPGGAPVPAVTTWAR